MELFVVNVIFMKCAVFNFLFLSMFSTLFFFLILVCPWPAIFVVFLTCTVCNVMFVHNEKLVIFLYNKSLKMGILAKGTV